LEKVTFKRNDGTVTKTVDLRYDMFNQLTQKVVDPDGALGGAALQTDDYLWDGGELVGVYGYNSLVFASGPAPDMVLFESQHGVALHALLGDHLNTVRDVIATNGTVENHLVYNSYGELKSQTGGGAYSPFHRFTGKPFDVAVGLQYNINRWYDPATGRWTSEDPIGFGGGHANLNVYVANSPTNLRDPFGTVIKSERVRTFVARKIPQSQFHLTTDAGTEYTGATSSELYDAIKQDKEKIDELIIKSHGAEDGLWDDDLQPFPSADPDRGKVWITDEKGVFRDVLPVLTNITNTNSSICLRGCASVTQAQQLFDLLGNGAEVTGNNTGWTVGIPFTT
jgi:RHS repeat-associated protein